MDLVSKYRLLGAAVWLGLLVIIVPKWYSEPVNFVPDGETKVEVKSTLPIVEHAYRLPEQTEKPLTNGQAAQQSNAMVDKSSAEDASSKVVKAIEPPKVIDKISNDKKYKGQWIVRLQAFSNIRQANELLGRLDREYDVYIKYFEKSKMYSVRTGPYVSKAKAEKDKQKLDKMLRTNGEVVQLP